MALSDRPIILGPGAPVSELAYDALSTKTHLPSTIRVNFGLS
ncbi:hypothetical protein Cflav_PD3496 [Pedosphaera parvula Ellin514]|uniref:Uncharacterized protein n=1 Tax=Pedosphaera parvula (strain Ellin514) TaxID=320771 RepID=B9XI33_PEDPL|nr:hypothetical protein Cflav_PD3496 [Pedosphaera parvula Ellin514]